MPKLTAASIGPAFSDLKASLPQLPSDYQNAADFDWAMHPGGATILSGAEKVMDITPEHMRASYDTYINHGNSSSATIFSVMNRLRSKEMDAMAPDGRVRDYVVGCAFGPGITVEMCMMKRNMVHRTNVTGLQTPPETPAETESEPSEAGDGDEWSTDTSGSPAERNSSSAYESQDRYARFVTESLDHLDLD